MDRADSSGPLCTQRRREKRCVESLVLIFRDSKSVPLNDDDEINLVCCTSIFSVCQVLTLR